MNTQSLIKQAIRISGNRQRQATSNTKTRGEVRGGGKKPWRQKGTGRARAGSSRSPIWVGGGITFGPSKERNFKLKLPKKMKLASLKGLFELHQKDKTLKIVANLKLNEPKTKLAKKLLTSLELGSGKVLFITKDLQPELVLGVANLKNVSVTLLSDLGVLDLANNQQIVTEEAVLTEKFPTLLTKKSSTSKITSKKKVKNAT